MCIFFFFFKQKTAYEMRISDWSSDVCSSDLEDLVHRVRGQQVDQVAGEDGEDADVEQVAAHAHALVRQQLAGARAPGVHRLVEAHPAADEEHRQRDIGIDLEGELVEVVHDCTCRLARSEEHTSELQSLMRLSYAVFCL